ncbi:MAG: DUF6350 family protein [Actinomycetes bacterium]
MASLLSPHRLRSSILLRATEARDPDAEPVVDAAPLPPLRWPIAAVLGGLCAALVGWVLVVGVTVLGWVAADPGTLSSALGTGTALWLLTNGAAVRLGAASVSLVPWGATALLAFVLYRFAVFAGRQARADPRAHPVAVAGVIAVAYLAPVLSVLLLTQPVLSFTRGLLAVPVALAGAALWGSVRGQGADLRSAPTWCRAGGRGVLAALLLLLAGGAAALVWSLIRSLGRVVSLTEALDPGVTGGITLVLLQLAVAPNAVIWAASYALGSGFVLGPGTLVAPASTTLGLLPGVPLLAGLPAAGPGSTLTLGWLVLGAAAGAVAALPPALGRPRRGVATTTLLGGAAGVAAALAFVALAWAAGGALGDARLAEVGPRLLPLLVLAGSTLGLSGMATGLVAALLRRRR